MLRQRATLRATFRMDIFNPALLLATVQAHVLSATSPLLFISTSAAPLLAWPENALLSRPVIEGSIDRIACRTLHKAQLFLKTIFPPFYSYNQKICVILCICRNHCVKVYPEHRPGEMQDLRLLYSPTQNSV